MGAGVSVAGPPRGPCLAWGPREKPGITPPHSLAESAPGRSSSPPNPKSPAHPAATVSRAGWEAGPGRRPASHWPHHQGDRNPIRQPSRPLPTSLRCRQLPAPLPGEQLPVPATGACRSSLARSGTPARGQRCDSQKPLSTDPQHVQTHRHIARSFPASPPGLPPCPGCPVLPAQHRCACHSGDELIAAGAEPGQDSVPPGVRHPLAPSGSPAAAGSALAPREICRGPTRVIPPGPTGQRGTVRAPRGMLCRMLHSHGTSPPPSSRPPAAGHAAFPTHTWHGEAAKLLSSCQGVPGRGREKGYQPRDRCRGFGHPWEPGVAPDLGAGARPVGPVDRQTQQDKQLARWRIAARETAFAASAWSPGHVNSPSKAAEGGPARADG